MSDFSPEQLEAISKLLQELPKATETLSQLASAAGGAASSLSGVDLDPLQQASRLASKEAVATAAAIKSLGRAAGQYTDAFLSAEKGTGKYSGALESAGDALGAFAVIAKGPLAKGALLAADALMKVGAASLKQNDILIDTFRHLSNLGNIDSSGTKRVLDMIHTMGGTTKDVAAFKEVLSSINPYLVAFGGNLNKGSDEYTKMMQGILAPSAEMEYQFKNLGLSTEQLVKFSGDYLINQTRLGMSQNKSSTQLSKSFLDLVTVTTELANLTGTSRDAQMEKLAENQRDVRWRMHLAGLSEEQRAVEMKALQAAQAHSKDMGELYKDQAASEGAVTSQKTAMLRVQMGDVFGNLNKAAKDNMNNSAGFVNASAAAIQKMEQTRGRYVNNFQKGFILPAENLGQLAISTDSLDENMKGLNYSQKDW